MNDLAFLVYILWYFDIFSKILKGNFINLKLELNSKSLADSVLYRVMHFSSP